MTDEKPRPKPAARRDEQAEEAQAALDLLRHQAGGALSGREVKERWGLAGDDADAPPLDWRMTPRNVALQVLAVLLFIAVVVFMVALMFDGFSVIFSHVTGG